MCHLFVEVNWHTPNPWVKGLPTHHGSVANFKFEDSVSWFHIHKSIDVHIPARCLCSPSYQQPPFFIFWEGFLIKLFKYVIMANSFLFYFILFIIIIF